MIFAKSFKTGTVSSTYYCSRFLCIPDDGCEQLVSCIRRSDILDPFSMFIMHNDMWMENYEKMWNCHDYLCSFISSSCYAALNPIFHTYKCTYWWCCAVWNKNALLIMNPMCARSCNIMCAIQCRWRSCRSSIVTCIEPTIRSQNALKSHQLFQGLFLYSNSIGSASFYMLVRKGYTSLRPQNVISRILHRNS